MTSYHSHHRPGTQVYGSVVAMDDNDHSQPQAGVTVELIDQDKKVAQSAVSAEDGKYSFQNVQPALWTIRASHATWTLANKEAALELVWDNTEVKQPFSVVGYQVTKAHTALCFALSIRVSWHKSIVTASAHSMPLTQVYGAVRASDAPILGVRVSLHPITREQYLQQQAGTAVDAAGDALQTVVSGKYVAFLLLIHFIVLLLCKCT